MNHDIQEDDGNELIHSRLLASHDGGHSWQRIRHPCRGFDKGTGVTSSDGRELWMSCYGSADTGSVYRSTDGGDHWNLTAAQPGADTARGSTGVNLEAIAPGVAVGSMRGGWLITTHDGGRHWMDNGQLFDDRQSSGELTHVGPLFVWAVRRKLRVVRTTDGARRWRAQNDTGIAVIG